ncbi:MAG: choice-of-anchor L domain-containing protein, partial [Thermoflexales bacterium]|nr:choice-of-anchor L domain-containing protein [Thermoflexales bacterium]
STLGNGNDLISGIPITVASYGRDYNFGELYPAQIYGIVFLDLNGDGYYAYSEPGIVSATLTLSGTNDRGQPVLVVTYTNSTGNFTFANLRPGTYTLSETQPSGYLDGQERSPAGTLSVVNDTFSAISVVAGNSYGQYQFGESGSFLSGYVYQDRNNDGIRSGYNETGISNVTVYLTGTRSDNGTTVGRVSTTDSAGVYQFTNVPNGVYTITEVQPAGYFDGRETLGVGAGGVISNNDRFNLITMSGPGGTNYNFGEIGPSTFGGVVFFDINDDGNRDGNEPGISGVTVYLRGTDYLTLPVWMTTTTDANGSFNFTNVRMGVYTVTEVQPAAYLDGKDKVGCCGGGTLGNDAVSSVTVLGADTLAFFYFGERISGLSGYVYQDNNNNGLRDDSYGSYGGVSGAAMTLYGFTTLGQAVTRTTTSDSYGFYYFNDLLTGTYRLSETQPSPWLDGREAAGGLGGTPGPNDVIDNIAFIPGQYGSDYNFGEFYASSLSGIVYWDVNNDGQKQLNEAGIVGATVVLSGTDDLNQGVRLTVTSSGGGAYGFSNLRPGTYALIEIQPGDYTDGLDAAGTVGGTPDGQDAITGIVVAPASSPNNYLFGERKLGITGYVYQDMNNDGARAPASEGGIANTLVTLDGTSLLGDAVSRVSVTNLYGFYTFGDLPAGAYVIHAFQPLGYLDGLEGIGSLGGLVGNDTFTVTYGAGQYGSEYNFGELPPASIQGTVYLDINGDAQQQNGEPGLPAVTLSLVGVNDLGATVSAMATTGGYGSFSFSGLRPGTYTITESQPEGYTDGNETLGALGGSVIGPDTIAAIPLGVGATAYNYRFGESQIGLGGLVYRDTDGDGFRDPFDPVLPGVTLILTGTPTVGAPITRTAQTDVFGFYRFGDVPAGTYRIREIQPPNLLDGPELSASPSGTPGPLGEDFIDIAFTGVGFVDGFDFTEYSPNLLRGYVFFDLDNDALFRWAACGYDTFCVWDQNRAEVPVGAGVRIVLTGRNDLSQTLWMTDVTNSSGQYSFPLLRPGTYTLTEVQRDVDVDGLDQAMFAPEAIVANDQVRAISLTLGETKGANFGEKPSLMGYVFRDDNENVIWEASSATGCNSPEFGIGGVSMALTGVDVYNNNVNLAATTFTPAGTPPWRCQEGIFFWGGLVTGTYSIHETQPAGYLDGPEIVGTAGGLTTTNDIIARIVFTPGIVITGYGFSEQRNAIAGNVFVDTNDNGLMDGSEGGLVTPAVITLQGINNLGQSVNLSITTYGAYQFTGLRPGTYTLTESQPAGYADGKEQLGIGAGGALGVNDQFINLVLPPGTAATGYNFGELTSGSIGGRVAYVWYPNGLTWLGAGIGGETIRLNGTLNAGGTAAVTTTTDASGYYRFNGLAPGVYTVTHASFPTGYRDFGVVPCSGLAAGRSITNVVLQYGTDQSYCDFKLGPTLSGYVFADHNANGAQESGEPGLWSVGLTLFGALNGGGAFTQSVGTDATGYFAFGGLLTGTYRIIEFQPDGFFDGLDTPGSFGGLTGTLGAAAIPPGSLVITSDLIAGIIYTPNLIGVNYRFAELKPASLSGRVFFDMNDDGIYSSPPDGLASPVDVYLDGTNDLGEQIRMTNTDHAAVFNFTGLRPGSYTLTEIQPPTYTDWIDMVGTQGGVLTNDLIRYIPLGWGDVGTDYNFGERKYGLVGYVYADNDNNGVYEPPPGVDNGIPGAVVWLSGTTSLGAPVAFSTTTFNNGLFSFPELQPGVYTLTEMQPPGYADGIDALGTLGGVLSNDQVKLIALGDHAYGEGYLFGELAPSSLSGYVYVDLDNDGYRAGYGEPGIGGVTITLQGTSSLGDPVLMVTRTNASGAYRFNAIPNGNYSLLEAQPAFADGIDRAGYGGAGGVALDDLIVGIGFNHILNATEYNFGERPSALSGRVFWDENGNGTRQITETGLSPATLKLHGVDFNGQPVLKTVKTGFDGYYAFEALPGTYWIEEIQPFGYLNGVALPGSLGGVIASPNVITQVVLGIGGSGQDYDFGEVAPTAVNLVQAMGLDLSALQGASLRTDLINKAGVGGLGTPTVAGFPTEGATFAYLGTGNMLFADQPNSSPNTFGLGDFAHLTLTVTVPTTATCLSFDFAFFSEEFPEFVGSAFNDGFDAFVDGRPVARDLNGNRISINSVFGATPANAAGSTYDAATPRLRAQAELTPGATSVISFTIADVTDTAYDSAVFIDKLRFSRPGGQGCAPGANLPISVALTKTVSVWPTVGNPVCGVTDTITVTAGTEVAYCYRATNTGEYTLTTHTLADTAFGTLFTALPQELLPGETYEFITSRVHTQSLVSVGSWTGTYSGTFNAVGSATTTVTIPGPAPTPTPVSPGSGFVSLQPIVVQTYLTAPVTITVMISGVTHLGGYETALRFDPAQVTVTAVSQAEFLTSTGRSLVALSTRTGPDYVRFGASTVGAASGPSGIGALARVRVSPRTVGTITLILSDTLATNEAGQAISLSVQNGALYVINPGKAYLPLVIR